MKVRVIQLYKKMEELERDQIELKKILERISSDRDYSEFLKQSFQQEIDKINRQIEALLNLKITGSESVPPEINEKKTGDVKKLYALNENKLSPEISLENISPRSSRELNPKTEKSTHKY